MPHVSRPLIGLLIATVLLLVLWVVALKPSGNSSGSSSSQGLGQYQHAINAAHAAVATANANSGSAAAADPGGSTPTTTQPPASTAAAHAPAAITRTTTTAVTHKHVSIPATKARTAAPTAAGRFAAVQRALGAHRVLALLFYNPAGADDRALRQELATVPAHGGRVFKLAVPISEIQNYLPIVSRVPVNVSPTLVIIAPGGQADEIVGYADPFEISQRVDDALSLRP